MKSRRRRSIRLPGFDYAAPGGYFITLYTRDRAPLFGAVIQDEMRLSTFGRVAAHCWRALPGHFPHVEIDAFVVMPNHIHGILVFRDKGRGTAPSACSPGQVCRAPTRGAHDSLRQKYEAFSRPVAGSLPTIIRSYKAAVTRACRQAGHPGPVWQRDYYEHIIRGEPELLRLRGYVATNPARWALDAENPDRIRQVPSDAL